MTEDVILSMGQLESILDNSPTSVIISALDDRELLYANQAARTMISPKYRGKRMTCYQAFGYDTPCKACPAGMAGDEPVLRELLIPENGHTYRFTGRDIDWAGRPAHIEYIADISRQKQVECELDHLVNSIPGGIASYEIKGSRFIPLYYSDGVMEISGHTREEYEEMIKHDALDVIYKADRERVLSAALRAFGTGEVLDVSYRMRHKNGSLIWIHLNGRRMGTGTDSTRFYAVFTGMSSESRLFQNITNETADGIYVIAKDNYELLYINETEGLFSHKPNCLGEKCYTALYGKNAPCEFCSMTKGKMEGEEHEKKEDGTEQIFQAYYRETDWNGIPAYVKYMRDVTESVQTRREKERLDLYFRSMVEQFPGGISMMTYQPDGAMKLEFISRGFAAMMQRTVEEAKALYDENIFAGIYPEDIKENRDRLQHFLAGKEKSCELIARMERKDGSYIWVSSTLSMLPSEGNVRRIYIVYTDISKTMEEKGRLQRQYEEQLLEHYHKPGANELILGHSIISKDKVVEIRDSTDSALLKRFGTSRKALYQGLAGLIIREKDRSEFLNLFWNDAMLRAFAENKTEQTMECFIRLPKEKHGRYVRFKVNLLSGPDGGEVIGILTVTDITEETISKRIFRQLTVTSYDYVMDVDLLHDTYTVLTRREGAVGAPALSGCHSERVAYMAGSVVLPKDSRSYAEALKADEIRRTLKEGPYTFTYSITDSNGNIRIKRMTAASVEPWLERYCLVCTDITDSVREQQGLLNMLAYTFELMGFLDVNSGSFTMYTRKTVLENLPPEVIEQYADAIALFAGSSVLEESEETLQTQLRLTSVLARLEREPSGYDFVASYEMDGSIRYKQFNVLWGNQNHSIVCVVRADVTDMIAAERSTKKELEEALRLAEEANRAKSDFLSAMSHDIRTPMNAIVGMTTLAEAHMDDRSRIEDCLQKITVSSRHLLSLINDVLDMSRIEQSQITLNRMKIHLSDLLEQLTAIIMPQAGEQGVHLSVCRKNIVHTFFYGDPLRINQVLINLLGNAVKFTPAGGSVDFLIEERSPEKQPGYVRYRFTVKDTGIGMTEGFLDRIFEPFIREQAVGNLEGTGLGLSITKRLVDLMEGRLSVKSRKEKGSQFVVELEFERAEDAGGEEERITGLSGKGKTKILEGRHFLIAEDNDINAEILCELLQMQGASSDLQPDGLQTVEAFRRAAPGTYDAVLMDIRMPKMNGYEATRAIRDLDHPDAKKIPIIAMTANAFAEDIKAAFEAGMTAHVAKPIDMKMLQSALAEAFSRHFGDDGEYTD